MVSVLERIHQDKLIEVRNKKKLISGGEICAQIKCSEIKIKNFTGALQAKIKQNKIAIIAEIKKASPSKGIIRNNFNPVEIAMAYEKNGAACISVLTDEKYFMGKNEYLTAVKKAVNLPILRKDFIIDPYQIWEAKLIGADCILLIMAMLDEKLAIELEDEAQRIGLQSLIEIHDEEDLKKALKLKSKLFGINNRNLKTLEVDLKTTHNLAPKIPEDKILICESGIKNKEDIVKMKTHGAKTFLIGESLMKEDDIGSALKNLID